MAQVADSDAEEFTPLTAEQAQALREQNPSLSPWWVVVGQLLVGTVVVLAAGLLTGSVGVARSCAWGVLAVVLPAALFARGLTGQFARANPGTAVASFFVWELAKIVVTVGVMYVAYRVEANLNWLAMLAGLVLTMKVYWLALGVKRKAGTVRDKTPNGKE